MTLDFEVTYRGKIIMIRELLIAASIIAAQSHVVLADDDPFGLAKSGKLECFAPDTDKKTCLDISHYTWQPDGTVLMEDEMAVSTHPLISMMVKSLGTVEGSSACVTVAGYSLKNVTFFKEGMPMSEEESVNYLQTANSKNAKLLGKKVCMDISPIGSLFITQFTVDDTPLPAATNRLKWIGADEGYVLAP